MGRPVRSVLALTCALALLPAWAAAQESATISGRVTSEAGAPLAAVSVFIEGLNTGTLTQEDGRYQFVVPGPRVRGQTVSMTARLIGYRAKTVQITLNPGAITQDFVLAANPLRLGEVVVTGAGTATTREKLGNVINTVDSALIARSNESNIVSALAAKAPNVEVRTQSGEPGASAYIRIRGPKTIQGTSQPLFVVDGVPIDNTTDATGDNTGSTTVSNRASDLNPDDIESIDVLKGAAAAAIYGARAAQGVILITTKSGKPGATRYSLRSSYTIDEVNRRVPLQTDFGQGSAGVAAGCGGFNCSPTSLSFGPKLDTSTPVYDHWSEMFHTGNTFDNNLSVSGGNDRTTFFLSAAYLDQKGVIIGPNNAYKKTDVRVKASHRLFDRLNIGGNVLYADARGQYIEKGSNVSGLLLGALRTSPNFNNREYLSPDGLQRSYRFPNPAPDAVKVTRNYDNPFFVVNRDISIQELNRVIGSANIDWDPLDWLSIKENLGGDYYTDWRNLGLAISSSAQPNGEVLRRDIVNYQVDHNLTATANHTFSPSFAGTLTLGQNLNIRRYRNVTVDGIDMLADLPFSIDNTVSWTPTEFRSTIHTESYFGQATADLFNQLFLTAALRNDGFSTFGASDRRHWFPKFSAAWTFTNLLNGGEGRGVLNFGKLRAAWGQTGREPGVYQTITALFSGGIGDSYINSTLTNQNGQGGLVTTFSRGNADVKPEITKETEVGLDLGLFDQKVDVGVTYYDSRTTDMLLRLPVPQSTGFSTVLKNGGELSNKGWEVTANYRVLTRSDLSWEVGAQWSRNRNKVESLLGAQYVDLPTGGYFSGTESSAYVGYALGVLRGSDFAKCGRGLVIDGHNIDQECGGAPAGALYIGADGFPVVDPTNRVIADPNPDWLGSIRTSFRFHKVQISGLLDIKHGGDVWNGTRGALYNFGTHKDTDMRDQTRTFGKDFMPGRDGASGAVAGPGAGTPINFGAVANPATGVTYGQAWFTGDGSGFGPVAAQFIEDGSYTKLREISVAYTLDNRWVHNTLGLSSVDLRLSGRNLKTWTKYRGIDPEANLAGAEVLIQGIDYFNNPMTRSFVFTVSLNR
ncbi:MAG: SusC/RagA family TonB-linked outer membrane protein [Gemmatimonadaceae bacterium]|nr:SusC/RagA family TonB-linked outer membrane protein [Gemmatimonadaceae bacterium]